MRLGWMGLLLLLPLLGCNGASDAVAAASEPKATAGKSGATLHIVRRTHPDPAWMREHLEGRIDACMAVLRAKGESEAKPPSLPSAADIAKWVTVEAEELYAGGRIATFSTMLYVAADDTKGCKLTFYKTLHASTASLCGTRYYGSAESDPATHEVKPPELGEEAAQSDPQSVKHCMAEAARKRDIQGMAHGVAAGGQACLWLDDTGADASKAAVEPSAPGLHVCMHPRYFDASLPQAEQAGDGALTLRVVRVLGPGEKVNSGLKYGMPETNAMRIEAEVVEEGQPIPDSRFSRQAVESFVKQPLVVLAGGTQ